MLNRQFDGQKLIKENISRQDVIEKKMLESPVESFFSDILDDLAFKNEMLTFSSNTSKIVKFLNPKYYAAAKDRAESAIGVSRGFKDNLKSNTLRFWVDAAIDFNNCFL